MADYTTLKTAVQIAIKTNNNNEITGKILQQQLLAMINSLGSDYQLAGILRPLDIPKTGDQRIAYLAVEPGMYEHAGGFEVTELSLLMYDTAWEVHPLGVPFGSQIAAVTKALQDADKANAKAIADEKASRTTAILAEQQAREQADTTLQENIDKKQDTISDLTTIRTQAAHGQTAFSWGDHSKVGYITGITKAMVEDVLTGNITSHTHTFASLTDKPTTISGYGIRDAYTKAETDRKVVELQGLIDSMFERVYDSNNKLIRVHSNVTISSSGDLVAGSNSGGGGTSGGGKTYLNELLDVQLATSSLSEGDMLMWNGDKYVNIPQSSITPDLSEYATKQWVLDKKYLTSVPVASVVGQTGNITTAQIATALTDAGYKLTDTTYELATTTSNGLMSATDKTKLDGIDANANNYTLPTASSSTKGGIKVGTTLSISGEVLDLKSGFPKGTYTKVQIDDYGRVVSGSTLSASDIPNLSWNKITTGKPTTISGYGITDAYTKTETDNKVAALQGLLDSMFERVYDSNNKLIRVHSNVTISSSGDLVAGSNSEGGGTSGGAYTQLEWNAIKALTQSESGLLASAYSVKEAYNELNTAIETLAGKATNVKFTQTLTSGKQIGSISIDGKSTSLFAPANYAWSEVTGKPTFATVATSGSYTDLTNKPTIASLMGSTAIGSTTAYPYWTGSAWATKSLGSNAFTSISKVSQLTNDSGYITGISKSMVENVLTGNITSHTHSYLPLSGGTITGYLTLKHSSSDTTSPLIIDTKSTVEVGQYFRISGTNKGWIGYSPTYGMYLYTYNGPHRIGIKDDGTGYIDSNTILHSSNFNSYAPKLDGTGASGTWGINISGNAATATKATQDGNGKVIADTYLPLSGGTINGTQTGPFNINTSATEEVGMRFFMSGSAKAWVGYAPDIGVYLYTYSNHKLVLTDAGVGFLDSNTIIHSGNYNSYAPKLDGTGATGTWGINIRGKANIANNLLFVENIPANTRGELSRDYRLYTGIWAKEDLGYASKYGQYIDLSGGTTWYHRLAFNTTGVIEHFQGINTTTLTKVGDLAYTSSNVASATKLANSRTIWGQSFDGTGNVDGSLSGVTNINSAIHISSSGGVSIGTTIHKGHKLTVSAIHSTNFITAETLNNAGFAIGNINESYGLMMWTEGNGHSHIQAGRTDGSGTLYNLSLQRFGGNVGIGTTSPAYKLHIVGTTYASENIIAAGDLTAGSDIRYKDKIQDLRLSIHDIALAPAFTYKWNNREDDALVHIGSSAQYWLNTDAKDAVYYDKQNDFYHLNYASLALCNTIILARGMETQEEKIARLEERINELEDKLRQYDSCR